MSALPTSVVARPLAATVRIATRSSDLALWQARRVARLLGGIGLAATLVEVTTVGDTDQRPFSQLPGSGYFTKAVQQAVLAGDADLAVHSFKDLPSERTPGLSVVAVPERADPRDVLLVRPVAFNEADAALPLRTGARIGTSAARRREQLHARRPDLITAELRGNVPTRVAKLRAGDYDAIVLAKAGLDRLELNLGGLHVVTLEPATMMPAPAQGALALECRTGDGTSDREPDGEPYGKPASTADSTPDRELRALLASLDDREERRLVTAERALMALFDAGCQLAMGALAQADETDPELVRLSAWYAGRSHTIAHADPLQAARLLYRKLTVA